MVGGWGVGGEFAMCVCQCSTALVLKQVCLVPPPGDSGCYVGTAVSRLRRPCLSLRLLLYKAISSRAEVVGSGAAMVGIISASGSAVSPTEGNKSEKKVHFQPTDHREAEKTSQRLKRLSGSFRHDHPDPRHLPEKPND